MGIFHFLNVKNGDCSIIQHPSERVTVIDVFNAENNRTKQQLGAQKSLAKGLMISAAYNQKESPVNPISYLRQHKIESVFRFILTHPDMDHMGGLKDLFDAFHPVNFWDTDNTCEKDFENYCPYDATDWDFYKHIRDSRPTSHPNRLVLYSGARGQFYTTNESGAGGDGLYVLAPTKELVNKANQCDDHNDASYVILYRSAGGRILLGGDSHDKTWEHILKNHEQEVKDVDLLIAPHHGRKSDRSYDFLDVVNPALTFFGNANSEHLAYDAWYYRNLPTITNNQANCMIVDTNCNPMKLYVTNRAFAIRENPSTEYSSQFQGYYLREIVRQFNSVPARSLMQS